MRKSHVVPCLALLLLLTKGAGIQFQVSGVRMVATVVALLVLLLVLSSLNVAVFGQAKAGSWRDRVLSIFIEIARVLIVGIGLAILLSQVWGADVGGLFTALGVTSLVVGLALQNAAGSIVSGLLLLFEQPFKLGDYLQTSTGKVPGVEGRVVEVNWRAVHIDTGGAICVVPNALLADSAFLNRSRPSSAVSEKVATKFANDDSPVQVCALLKRLAADLPGCPVGMRPVASVKGGGAYEVVLHLQDLTDIANSRSLFLSWLWFASRREGLHLDGADPGNWTTARPPNRQRDQCAPPSSSPPTRRPRWRRTSRWCDMGPVRPCRAWANDRTLWASSSQAESACPGYRQPGTRRRSAWSTGAGTCTPRRSRTRPSLWPERPSRRRQCSTSQSRRCPTWSGVTPSSPAISVTRSIGVEIWPKASLPRSGSPPAVPKVASSPPEKVCGLCLGASFAPAYRGMSIISGPNARASPGQPLRGHRCWSSGCDRPRSPDLVQTRRECCAPRS